MDALTQTLDASWYVDPAIHAAEQRAIFGSSWQLVGHESEHPPGSATEVDLGAASLVLARDPDGVLRGFHNVCRHRAAPLLSPGEHRRCRALRCPYHGFQYDLRGRLTKTPGFGAVLDAATQALHPVEVGTWRGFVFVHLGDDPEPLDAFVAPLEQATAGIDLASLSPTTHAVHPIACNWKTYVDNYLEGYHVPYLHPSLSRQVDVQGYQVVVSGRTIEHRSPTRSPSSQVAGLWLFLWPNVALNIYARGMSLERIVPTGPQAMEIRYTYLFHDGVTTEERAREQALSAEITAEDIAMVEAVQRNLTRGVYTTGWLSPVHENGLAAFQGWVRDAMGR